MSRSLFGTRVDRVLSAATRGLRRTGRRPGTGLRLGVESLEVRALLANVTVHVFDFNFSTNPQGQPIVEPTIKVGDTIHWVWDSGLHSTTSVAGIAESWNSGLHSPSFSFDHTFTHVGVFAYYCSIHGSDAGNGKAGGMSGTVTVTAAQAPLVTVTNVQFVRNKRHLVTQITVDFSGAVNVSEADSVTTYRLATAGKKGSFDAKNARLFKLKSAVYDAALHEVTLNPKKPFGLSKPVQLRVNGLPPAGLLDSLGRLIDGDHNGTPGGNAVAVLRASGVTLS
jgi:plastocyanin